MNLRIAALRENAGATAPLPAQVDRLTVEATTLAKAVTRINLKLAALQPEESAQKLAAPSDLSAIEAKLDQLIDAMSN